MDRRIIGALALGMAAASAASAAPRGDIRLDDVHVYPESMSATVDGTVYIGSIKGVVFRAKPGGSMAEPWIKPEGVLSIFGVLADARSRTLWLCSTPNTFSSPPVIGTSALMALDLESGKLKGVYPFPAPASDCNDVTVAQDGTAYVTDTPNGRIFTLKPGAKTLALFAEDPLLKGVNGIAFSGDGTLYASLFTKGQLVRLDRGIHGAYAGVTTLRLSQPVTTPDGFRLISGKRFLLAEAHGKIDEVTIDGDRAHVRTLKEGLSSTAGVTMVGGAAYAIEGKMAYLLNPALKGQEPGAFAARVIPLK